MGAVLAQNRQKKVYDLYRSLVFPCTSQIQHVPLWNKLPPALRQISDPSYELTQTSPLAISPHLFHSKLKTLLLIHRLPHTSLPVSTPSTIHHSRLTVCLPDSLDLDRCASILFWLSACE